MFPVAAPEAADRRIQHGRAGLKRRQRVRVARVARVVPVETDGLPKRLDALDQGADRRRRRDPDRVGEDEPARVELRRELGDGAGVDLGLEGTAEGDADRRRGGPVGHGEDPLHTRRRLRERGVPVPAVERVRRTKRHVDAVELGSPEPLEALLVEDETGVFDPVASCDPRSHRFGPGHLRHALVADEADRLDPR